LAQGATVIVDLDFSLRRLNPGIARSRGYAERGKSLFAASNPNDALCNTITNYLAFVHISPDEFINLYSRGQLHSAGGYRDHVQGRSAGDPGMGRRAAALALL